MPASAYDSAWRLDRLIGRTLYYIRRTLMIRREIQSSRVADAEELERQILATLAEQETDEQS